MHMTRARLSPTLAIIGFLVTRSVLAQEAEPPQAAPPEPPVEAPTPEPTPTPPPQPSPHRLGTNDKRRTLRSYPANLAYNALGVFTKTNRITLLAGGAIAATSHAFDDDVASYFHNNPHEQFGKIGQALGGGIFIGAATLGVFGAARMTPWDRFRASTYDVSQAVIVNLAYVFVIKAAAGRERPDGSNKQSFPSGHASDAFAVAAVLDRHYSWRVSVPTYAVATFIAASRLAAEKHFLSDVTFGAAFGFGVGRTVVRRNNRPPTPPGEPAPKVPPPKKEHPELRLMPDVGPSGDGSGLRLSIIF
jgi:membrane-associated phospholipid phosphatase